MNPEDVIPAEPDPFKAIGIDLRPDGRLTEPCLISVHSQTIHVFEEFRGCSLYSWCRPDYPFAPGLNCALIDRVPPYPVTACQVCARFTRQETERQRKIDRRSRIESFRQFFAWIKSGGIPNANTFAIRPNKSTDHKR